MNWTHFIFLGALFSGLGVGLGAFGAHALKNTLSEYALGVFETGVRYQMYHGLALLAVGFVASRVETTAVKASGIAFAVGILIFSGSLYTLALSGQKWWGAITLLAASAFLQVGLA